MLLRKAHLFLVAALTVSIAACTERRPASHAETEHPCDAPGVHAVVEQLGERLHHVSLLAPDSIAVREIRAAYAFLVTPDLLGTWVADPTSAPGREVSSPWPERIEVSSVEAEEGVCRVEGEVVYVTSVEETQGGAAFREPVILRVEQDGAWRISAYEEGAPLPVDSSTTPEGLGVFSR